ncbi:MAG: hypothetical protein MR607_03750 [Lachnospiraceae bacterium]|nr:hypothetical protein [Lachnospiraceae bacterium]
MIGTKPGKDIPAMKEMLYLIVEYIARIHDKINTLNDHTKGFTDKELHFIVIGVIGMLMVFVLVPLVRWLAERGHYLFLTWFYVVTVLIVLTFAIEIGQGITHTGTLDFYDIVSGLFGFFAFYAVYLAIRYLIIGIAHLFTRK